MAGRISGHAQLPRYGVPVCTKYLMVQSYRFVLRRCRPRSFCPGLGSEVAKTILVADDNPLIRKVLCRMFEAENDYDICAEAPNGQEAIALAQRHSPDLIILDLSMPVMNGWEAARQLKKLMPDVPIILFTQYVNPGTDMFGPNSPFDRIVSKIDGKTLAGHVRSLIPV